MINTRGHLSSETIDLLLLSALDAKESNEAKAHLDDCTMCKERWRELNEDKKQFEQFVFARTLPKIEERVAKQSLLSRFTWQRWVPALGLAAAAAVAVMVMPRHEGDNGDTSGQTEDDIYVGYKGNSPRFEVFAKRDTNTFQVKAGSQLKAKDRIRFVVNPAGAKYVLIASRDAKGAFTVYHPYGATESAPVDPSQPHHLELPNAVELDETPGLERLVAVFSDAPVKAADVEAALKANPSSPPLQGARVITWEFEKVLP
jgi:hypothetical protein